MKPLRLTMTAFGAYPGTEVVDFEALGHLGLFVVAGGTGSGKTTIFDALYYCLYGSLPGRRATYSRLRSDHAPAGVECELELDFEADGQVWRVTRSPKQTRPKRRGGGFTESQSRAALFRVEDGKPVAVVNKLGEVTAKCHELVGLSGHQFERVALLPQGEFSRVLTDSGNARRDLLRKLFSSDVFGDASEMLKELAAKAVATDDALAQQLHDQLVAVGQAVGHLTNTPASDSAAGISEAIETYRCGPIAELDSRTTNLALDQAGTTEAHQLSVQIAGRVAHRNRVRADLAAHLEQAQQVADDLRRLRDGRAAIPVVNASTNAAQQSDRLDQATKAAAKLQARVGDILAELGFELASTEPRQLTTLADQVTRRLSELVARREALTQLETAALTITKLQTSVRRSRSRSKALDNEQEMAQARQRQLEHEREQLTASPSYDECLARAAELSTRLELRRELETLTERYAVIDHDLGQAQAEINRLEHEHGSSQAAQVARIDLHKTATRATTELEEFERLARAGDQYISATNRLADARQAHRTSREQADRLWDRFVGGTASRLAETLNAHAPCPVCGSCEHPAPALPSDPAQAATQADVAVARDNADELGRRQRTIETEIELLVEVDPELASLDRELLKHQITQATSAALTARQNVDDNHVLAIRVDELAADAAQRRAARDRLSGEQREVEQGRNRLLGALGETATQPVDALATIAQAASAAVDTASRAAGRLDELEHECAQAETTIADIGAQLTQTNHDSKSHATQLAELQGGRTQLATTLGIDPDAEVSIADQDRVIRVAERAVRELSDLQSAVARRYEVAMADQRAQAQLSERLSQSPFDTAAQAQAAFVEPGLIDLLETSTGAHAAALDRLRGALDELAELPEHAPDVAAAAAVAAQARSAHEAANRELISQVGDLDRFSIDIETISARQAQLVQADLETRRLERVAAIVKGDNERNTSLENWVLGAHLRDVVELANVRLARSTQQRFQLCVLDDGETRRGTWGLDLAVEDTVTGTQRPTAGLSGGELFQASLALALGLADVVMTESAGVRIDALFIDEGFGSLDESSVERAIDLLDELRSRGAMVGVITHVPAVLDALPRGITVEARADGNGSTIRQRRLAA